MNILEMLSADHRKVEEVFARLNAVPATDASGRDALLGTLGTLLRVHSHAEQEVFYAPLGKMSATHDDIEEGLREHRVMEERLEGLAALPRDRLEWAQELESLRKCVAHHVEEEEGEVFPKARRALDQRTLDEMGERFVRAKEKEERGRA